MTYNILLAKNLHKRYTTTYSGGIQVVLRRKTFLHIFPTLVNLQWYDQLNRTGNFIPSWGAEYNGAYHCVSSLYELLDESPFPHVTWTDVFLQQSHVSSPKPGRCLLLPDFVETPQRREVYHRLKKSSASYCRILNYSVRLPLVSGSGPVGIAVGLTPMRKCDGVNAPESSSVCTMGLELMAASIATRVVFSPSSGTWNRPGTLRRQRFVVPTILSQHPPHPAALRAINFQVIR